MLTADPMWADWSESRLDAARLRGRVTINEIVYAELSMRALRMEDVRTALADVHKAQPPQMAATSAGFRIGTLPTESQATQTLWTPTNSDSSSGSPSSSSMATTSLRLSASSSS